MTATDELRRLLDERGVEWEQSPQDGWYRTEWTGRYGKCNAMEWKPALTVMMPNLTPEQAIAATLGDKRDRTEEWLLNACNQAAADYIAELERKLEAATLGGGECEMETDWDYLHDGIPDAPEDTWAYKCSACGWSFRYDRGIKPKYCPNCGKAVKR